MGEVDNELTTHVKTTGAGEFNNKFDEMISNVVSFDGVLTAAGAALGYFGAKALAGATQAAMKFEEQMIELQKVTDEATMEKMTTQIQNMARSIPVAQKEMANIAAEAGRLGIKGTENIKRFTKVVSQMKVATEISAEDAARALAKIVEMTDATTGNIRGVGAAVNALSNNVAADSQEIIDATERSAASLTQNLGLSADRIFALSAALTSTSASARNAGRRLRRFGQQLRDPRKIKELATAFGTTTDELERLRDRAPLKFMLTMVERYREGGQAAEALNKILSTQSQMVLSGLAQKWEKLPAILGLSAQQFKEHGSLQREFNDAMATAAAKVGITKNLMRNLGIQTGGFLLPIFKDMLVTVNDLTKGFNDFNKATGGAAAGILALTVTAGGLSIALQSLGTIVGGFSMARISTVISRALTPLTLLIVGIGALAAAWGQNFGEMKTQTKKGMGDITRIFGENWAIIMGSSEISKEKLKSDADGLWDYMEERWENGLAFVVNNTAHALDMTTTMFADAFQFAAANAEAFVAVAKDKDKKARKILSKSVEKHNKMWDRFTQRWKDREEREQAILDSGPDENVLPTSDESDDDSKGKSKSERLMDKYLEQYKNLLEKASESTKMDTVENIMSKNEKNTRKVASALGDKCSIREHLLGPYERVPQGAGGQGKEGLSGTIGNTGKSRRLLKQQLKSNMPAGGTLSPSKNTRLSSIVGDPSPLTPPSQTQLDSYYGSGSQTQTTMDGQETKTATESTLKAIHNALINGGDVSLNVDGKELADSTSDARYRYKQSRLVLE